MRRSASSSRAWQKRDSCTPRSYSSSDFSSGEVALLELLDDGFELGDGGFEVLDGGIHAVTVACRFTVAVGSQFRIGSLLGRLDQRTQFAAFERHAHRVAGGDGGGVAEDARARRRPSRPRSRARARRAGSGRRGGRPGRLNARSATCRRRVDAARQVTVAGHQPRAHRGEAMARIELLERAPQPLVPAARAARATRASACRSAAASSATCRPRIARRPR